MDNYRVKYLKKPLISCVETRTVIKIRFSNLKRILGLFALTKNYFGIHAAMLAVMFDVRRRKYL